MSKEINTFVTDDPLYNKQELIAVTMRLIALGIGENEIVEDVKSLNKKITELEIAVYGKERTIEELVEQLNELDVFLVKTL